MFSARTAFNQTTKVLNSFEQVVEQHVEKSINKAIAMGDYYCVCVLESFEYPYADKMVDKLTNLGYLAVYHNNIHTIKINWSDPK